jgi:hypothetical protein
MLRGLLTLTALALVGCARSAPTPPPPPPGEDRDGDGWFTPEDCNDDDPLVNPDGQDACVDGQRPTGTVVPTCSWAWTSSSSTTVWWTSTVTAGDVGTSWSICAPPPGPIVALRGDCDDQDPAVNPDAEEVCGDAKDNNCDEQVDEGCST